MLIRIINLVSDAAKGSPILKTAKHISDRIRLMIVTKQFQVGEVLPSTRVLGKQLNSSFHTVRKAYQSLEQEGLL